mmetsp:Transcript_27584/g.68572  ORF Transcript_27584/g.68572 Transcript_27584/m.68572 type:complete len:87 (-) Transcript_27584:300-560(-)
MELFKAWEQQRVKSGAEVTAALKDDRGEPKPEAQQLEFLRKQIEMRTHARPRLDAVRDAVVIAERRQNWHCVASQGSSQRDPHRRE